MMKTPDTPQQYECHNSTSTGVTTCNILILNVFLSINKNRRDVDSDKKSVLYEKREHYSKNAGHFTPTKRYTK